MDETEKAKQLIDKFGFKAVEVVIEIISSNPHSNFLNTAPVSTVNYWLLVMVEVNKIQKL